MQQLFRQAGTFVPASNPTPDGSTASPKPSSSRSSSPSRRRSARRLRTPTRLSDLQARIAAAQAREAELSSEIGSIEGRIRTLEQQVGGVSAQLETLERDLALQQEKLDRITSLFELQTEQLDFLKREYAVSLGALNRRLIDLYESDDPTTLDVLLSTESLSDFLDQIDYVRDLGSQDVRITTQVNTAKVRMHAAREKTKVTSNKVATVTRTIAVRTAQVRSEKERLLISEKGLAKAKGHKKEQLVSIQQSKQEYLNEVAGLQASYSAVSAQIQASGSSSYDSSPSSSGLIWPVNGPVVSPFGMRWGRLHAGIDIGVGYGTPIHAAASGDRHLRGLDGRLRQLRDHRPRRRALDGLRAPVEHRRRRRQRLAGPGDRLRGLHGPLLRPASPLRGAHQRLAGRSARLPLVELNVGEEALSPARSVTEGRAEARLDERNPRRLQAGVGSRAAPGPVERVADEIGLDGIAGEIAAGIDEVCVALDLTRKRVGTEEM